MMKILNRFTVGLGIGYVLGAKAGRERYEQIASWWNRVTGTPALQRMTEQGRELAGSAAHKAQEVSGKLPGVGALVGGDSGNGHLVRDVMTSGVETVSLGTPIKDVAERMKKGDAGAMVVTDDSNAVIGIVTDRDIAVRAAAAGKPPTAPVGEIVSKDVTTVSPDDKAVEAVKRMRQHAVRRLPVVSNGKAVGIVSLGDLAEERDRSSALADISSAPPNR
jgi:CBS domain-containing protein